MWGKYLLVAGVAIGAGLVLAGPAAAESLEGSFSLQSTQNGNLALLGTTFTATPCGPDCVRATVGKYPAFDMHLQGNAWVGSYPWEFNNAPVTCTITINSDAQFGTQVCPGAMGPGQDLSSEFNVIRAG